MARRICLLLKGGEVALDFERDVQAVIPQWDTFDGHYTRVIASNGLVYRLQGTNYKVRA